MRRTVALLLLLLLLPALCTCDNNITSSAGDVVVDTVDYTDYTSSGQEEPQEHATLCDLPQCTCVEHATKSNVPGSEYGEIDILCTCQYSNSSTLLLPSPTPVPARTRLLHIGWCDHVTITPVDLTADVEFRPLGLVIESVKLLTVQKGGAFWAKNSVLLWNITAIPELPHGVLRSASFQEHAMERFDLEDSVVEVVKTAAFGGIFLGGGLRFKNVNITRVEENAFHVTLKHPNASFEFDHVSINELDAAAVGVIGRYVTLNNTQLGSVSSHGLQVHAEHFVLANSVVAEAQGFALNVQARDVIIVHNNFVLLQSNAFFGVQQSPLFKGNSEVKWQYRYVFASNLLHYAMQGSLNPNWKLGTRDLVENNVFVDCSCVQLGWMWSVHFEPQVVEPKAAAFYSRLLHEDANNRCYGKCSLLLHPVVQLFGPVRPMEEEDAPTDICAKNETTSEELCHFLGLKSRAGHVRRVTWGIVLVALLGARV